VAGAQQNDFGDYLGLENIFVGSLD